MYFLYNRAGSCFVVYIAALFYDRKFDSVKKITDRKSFGSMVCLKLMTSLKGYYFDICKVCVYIVIVS